MGPDYADWDASIARKFPFSERTNLQFRAEYFNLLNHTNMGDPATDAGRTFGRVTSTTPQNWAGTARQNDPRIAQFSLKLLSTNRGVRPIAHSPSTLHATDFGN